ncbi:hypothetical protein RJG79_00260 [Mycoplasmatota bacterium WC44]
MKQLIKIYAVVSALILFSIFTLAAFAPETFMSVFEKVVDLKSNGGKILSIYSQDLSSLETLLTLLVSGYIVNLLVNLLVLVIAYITEDKFNVRITLYVLAINLLFAAIGYYIVKLVLETGVKGIGATFRALSRSK